MKYQSTCVCIEMYTHTYILEAFPHLCPHWLPRFQTLPGKAVPYYYMFTVLTRAFTPLFPFFI